MKDIKKLVAVFDTHYGFEVVNGKKKPIHNAPAIAAMMKFVADFQPDIFVHGGDGLDCGAVSHWNRSKRKSIEGLRLVEDAREFKRGMLDQLNSILKPNAQKVYHIGNHEAWLEDLLEEYPGLEDIVSLDHLLGLTENNWTIIPQGGVSKFGKLYFAHGDNVGGKYVANQAVMNYERSIRVGHHHTYQVDTKVSAIDITDSRTGVAMPCMCNRGPSYGKKRPNRWVNGFLVSYLFPDGSFNDYVVIVVNGRFCWEGKVYKG
jgi:hypothetical protein